MWSAEGVDAQQSRGWWGRLVPRVLGTANCLGLSHKKLIQGGHTWGRGRMEIEFGGQVWKRWEGTFAREALCTEVLCHPLSCLSGSSECEQVWLQGAQTRNPVTS